MASYGPLKQSLGMLHLQPNRHPKATHQWLLMGVQACHLPALKPLKPSKRFKPLKILQPLKRWLACFILQPTATPRPHINGFLWPLKQSLGMLHPAANRHPKATHQWLLMGRLNNPLACFILQPTGTQGHTSMASYGRPSLPACQPLNP